MCKLSFFPSNLGLRFKSLSHQILSLIYIYLFYLFYMLLEKYHSLSNLKLN